MATSVTGYGCLLRCGRGWFEEIADMRLGVLELIADLFLQDQVSCENPPPTTEPAQVPVNGTRYHGFCCHTLSYRMPSLC